MSSAERALETATRARTRRAILDAAVTVLSQDPTASLGDIAAAAGVGRTTLHRYFPERSALQHDLGSDALERIDDAAERAHLARGSAPEALGRLCQELFELGDLLMLIFSDPQFTQSAAWTEYTASDRAIIELVESGHRDGTVDPELPPEWVQNLLWSLLYSAWQHASTEHVTKHQALSLCLRTLRKSIAA
ncbi:TetR/AcrR family transcriptional regulator [Saccharopolyspora cebuensis]|uniref:TetR/AcrR family transcriptional regulator n=1 Tax=Saccharopolyspora cebuensis TaxID=418759 RepID=A0ABV4CFP0_9PSEU